MTVNVTLTQAELANVYYALWTSTLLGEVKHEAAFGAGK